MMRYLLRSVTLASLLWAGVALGAGAPVLEGYGITQPGRTIGNCTVTPSTATVPFTIALNDLLIVNYIADSAFPGGTNACTTTTPGPVENWNCSVVPSGSDTQIWWHLATAADVSASQLTFHALNSFNVCTLVDYRGVNPSDPIGSFVTTTGTASPMSVVALSSLPPLSSVLLFENQDDANVGGFSIATITPSGSPWNLVNNFNGDVSPFSASFAILNQTNVTHTSTASASLSPSDDWATVAIPIFSGAQSSGIFATLGY